MYNNFYGQNYNPYQPQGYMQNYRQPNYAQQPQPQQNEPKNEPKNIENQQSNNPS
jgi:hypothetical protein